MLDFIWTKIRKDRKRRILIVDEAWYMMQSEDSAKFMYSIAKRARKYYLGLSTITQDVADFLGNEMGRAIISNSSIQVLMKQSPSAVELIQKVFNLSDGERNFLLNCDKRTGAVLRRTKPCRYTSLIKCCRTRDNYFRPKRLRKIEEHLKVLLTQEQ